MKRARTQRSPPKNGSRKCISCRCFFLVMPLRVQDRTQRICACFMDSPRPMQVAISPSVLFEQPYLLSCTFLYTASPVWGPNAKFRRCFMDGPRPQRCNLWRLFLRPNYRTIHPSFEQPCYRVRTAYSRTRLVALLHKVPLKKGLQPDIGKDCLQTLEKASSVYAVSGKVRLDVLVSPIFSHMVSVCYPMKILCSG